MKKSPSKQNRSNLDKKKGNNKKLAVKKVLKITLLALVFLMLAGIGGVSAMMVNYIQGAPDFDPANLDPPETSYLYDREGEKTAQFSGEQNRITVDLDDIPEHVQKAFIAIEDERFFDHFGVDPAGIVRAAWINLQQQSIVQGASTITQQLTRNAFLTPDQSMERKVQEAWMAILMEREYTKEEILELYLNRIYFGNGAYGVEAAAQTYYDKNVDELSIAEAAELAGILSAPNDNNPWSSEENALRGRTYTINRMEATEFISSEEAEKAREKELTYAEPVVGYSHPHFVDQVLHHELLDILKKLPEYGSDRDEAYDAIYTQGLRVYTTLDTELQTHVEDVLNNDDLYPRTVNVDIDKVRDAIDDDTFDSNNPIDPYIDDEKGIPQPQAAMVLADPNTGELLALGGGRHYEKDRDENVRFRNTRQPGSAIKPVIDYAPAFEEKLLAPGSVVDDAPREFSTDSGTFRPENWNYRFYGLMTAREALVLSRNVPAVETLKKVGTQKAAEYAKEMGITTIRDDELDNLSLGLGTMGATAKDMAQAFGTLANEGVKVPYHTVTRIEDRQGNIIWERQDDAESQPERVLSQQTAYMVNDILEETHRRFLPRRLDVDGRQVAAKTGTTDGRRDTYLASYTPNLVSTFWMGYDIERLGQIGDGHNLSTNFTRRVFEKAFEDLPHEEFQRPEGLVSMEVCTKSGLRPTEECEEAGHVTTDLFVPELAPQKTCEMHVEMEVYEAEEGEYFLPGPYTPVESLVTRIFLDRPEFKETDGNWSGDSTYGSGRKPEDADNLPPEEEYDGYDKEDYLPEDLFSEWNEEEKQVVLNWESPNIDYLDLPIQQHRLYRASGDEDFPEDPITVLPGEQNNYHDDYEFTREETYRYRLIIELIQESEDEENDEDQHDNQEIEEWEIITEITIPVKEEDDDDEDDEEDEEEEEDEED